MKNQLNIHRILLVTALMSTFFQCTKDEIDPGNKNPEAISINEYISQMPDWSDQTTPVEWDSLIGEVELYSDEKIPSVCNKYKTAISISKDQIIAVGTNFGKIWPGALIEGNSLESGDLKLINIDRSGIILNTNLPINQTYREIENPNSVSVQQAISEMQIESGLMPDGVQAGAGIMDTRVEEYSTFLQAMLAMEINGGFTEPQTKIKLSGEVGGSIEFEYFTHSVIAKFVQSAFTVRLADDLIETPADFFANSVTMEDIKKLESNGTMNANNVPLYIESVTYGRFLLFSLTSTAVESGVKLKAALEASWEQYAEGGGELSAEFKTALASKTTKIFSAGGSEEGANAAVANLDWNRFFVEAPVTTAVPISFVARTLNGKRKVVLIDNAVYEHRGDCAIPEKISIRVDLRNVTHLNPGVGTVQYESVTFKNNQQIGDLIELGEFITLINTDKVVLGGKGYQVYEWNINESDPDIDNFIIRSANNIEHNNQKFAFPFSNLNEGIQNKSFISTNNFGGNIQFDYKITKSFVFQ
ncbi:MAG: thiol-activated cytolysin family protein [Cyclobacteriaceae bacterium]|nr:thiol-activated cytolysin family protein [Cyclobacteriaceae bacterium]